MSNSSRAIAAARIEASTHRKRIVLPFPHAVLAGHNKGYWANRSSHIAKHRQWARNATLAASLNVPPDGDIAVKVRFFPPNNRGDRINYPIRLKPYFDGIADALKVSDSRFVPAFEFHDADRVYPRVEVEI